MEDMLYYINEFWYQHKQKVIIGLTILVVIIAGVFLYNKFIASEEGLDVETGVTNVSTLPVGTISEDDVPGAGSDGPRSYNTPISEYTLNIEDGLYALNMAYDAFNRSEIRDAGIKIYNVESKARDEMLGVHYDEPFVLVKSGQMIPISEVDASQVVQVWSQQ